MDFASEPDTMLEPLSIQQAIRTMILATFVATFALVATAQREPAIPRLDGLPEKIAKKKQAEKPKSQVLSKVTEETIEIPMGTPERILDHIERASDPDRIKGYNLVDRIRNQMYTTLKGADMILAHPAATEEQKAVARLLKLRALYQAAHYEEPLFSSRLRQFVEQLNKDFPGSDIAALGSSYLRARTLLDRPYSNDVMLGIENFQKQFPKSEISGLLFLELGRRLESEGRLQDAKDVYEKGSAAEKGRPAEQNLKLGSIRVSQLGKTLDWTGPTLAGSEIGLPSLRGNVVLIIFWSSKDDTSRVRLATWQKIDSRFRKDGLRVVGVALDESKEALQKFLKDNVIEWPVVYFEQPDQRGLNNPLARSMGVANVPTTYLLDKTGKVIGINIRGEKALIQAIVNELKPTPK